MFAYLLKYLYLKIKVIFILLCLLLYIQPLSANICVRAFKKIHAHYVYSLHTPGHIKLVQRITGLTNEEIKDSIILDVGSHFTYNFAEHARIEMGAKTALAVKTLTERPSGLNHALYDIPEYRILRMHPLFPLTDREDVISSYSQSAPVKTLPFKPSEVKKKLGGAFADITISLSVIGQFNMANISLWMEQLTKVTKPGGLIIVDFGKHYSRNPLRLSVSDFERILSQMKSRGVIAGYAPQHKNHKITRFTDRRFPNTSTTYRVINAYKRDSD
ncbi:MAG: hypothetical protein OXH36_05445 [Bdellovibrionales bacterium]|nr:hypothetical protein [Bdellovibrionales bacterium]